MSGSIDAPFFLPLTVLQVMAKIGAALQIRNVQLYGYEIVNVHYLFYRYLFIFYVHISILSIPFYLLYRYSNLSYFTYLQKNLYYKLICVYSLFRGVIYEQTI